MEERETAPEKIEDMEEKAELLRDRFRLSVIEISDSEAKKQGLEIAESVVACISDLAFKFTEQLGNDVVLFAQHAGRKSINMEDVILSAHRNDHLLGLLRSFCQELKGKESKTGKLRKRPFKEDTTVLSSLETSTGDSCNRKRFPSFLLRRLIRCQIHLLFWRFGSVGLSLFVMVSERLRDEVQLRYFFLPSH